jgi:hypothetical protein
MGSMMRGELSCNCLLDTIFMPKICKKYTFFTSSFSNHTWNWLKKLWHDHCMKNKNLYKSKPKNYVAREKGFSSNI